MEEKDRLLDGFFNSSPERQEWGSFLGKSAAAYQGQIDALGGLYGVALGSLIAKHVPVPGSKHPNLASITSQYPGYRLAGDIGSVIVSSFVNPASAVRNPGKFAFAATKAAKFIDRTIPSARLTRKVVDKATEGVAIARKTILDRIPKTFKSYVQNTRGVKTVARGVDKILTPRNIVEMVGINARKHQARMLSENQAMQENFQNDPIAQAETLSSYAFRKGGDVIEDLSTIPRSVPSALYDTFVLDTLTGVGLYSGYKGIGRVLGVSKKVVKPAQNFVNTMAENIGEAFKGATKETIGIAKASMVEHIKRFKNTKFKGLTIPELVTKAKLRFGENITFSPFRGCRRYCRSSARSCRC